MGPALLPLLLPLASHPTVAPEPCALTPAICDEIALLHRLSVGAPPPGRASFQLPAEPCAACDLPVRIDEPTRAWLGYFLGPGRAYLRRWLGRLRTLGPAIERELALRGLPSDLLYLAVLESGLLPEATSTRGAAGLWQFMPETARAMGLSVSGPVDERRDVDRSTFAAVALLAELHGSFGDWWLALTAYNTGPGNLRRAIRAAQSRDIQKLAASGQLSAEAAHFVPKLQALILIGHHARALGLDATP